MKANQNNEISLTMSVYEILERAHQAGEKLPSIRSIRSMIGHGSLTTISKAIHAWKVKQLQSKAELPEGLPEQAVKDISDAVWQAVLPILRERMELIQNQADERIELEKNEAAKIQETAAEALAEANAKEEALIEAKQREATLTESVAQLNGALNEARAANSELREAAEEMRKELDAALKEAAAAKAALASLKKMLPFLDPKLLAELSNAPLAGAFVTVG